MNSPKKIIYKLEPYFQGSTNTLSYVYMPQCPTCKNYPTYDLNPCPYCEQELDYEE